MKNIINKGEIIMGLFGLGKKKEDELEKSNSCCGGVCEHLSDEKVAGTKEEGGTIKVLGSGCTKCNELEANVKKALEQLGMETAIEHVTDFSVIAAYGVMSTPALVVDEKVVSYGKVLKVDEAVKLLQKIR
jgi:small redox-active disulfide protein 2